MQKLLKFCTFLLCWIVTSAYAQVLQDVSVIQLIYKAQRHVLLADYEFTSSALIPALKKARQRGVNVIVILHRSAKPPSKYAAKLVRAGVNVRIETELRVHNERNHNPYIIVDYSVSNDSHFSTFSQTPDLVEWYGRRFIELQHDSELYNLLASHASN